MGGKKKETHKAKSADWTHTLLIAMIALTLNLVSSTHITMDLYLSPTMDYIKRRYKR